MSLFSEDTIYVSEKNSQTAVFEEIYQSLLAKKLVSENFLDNLIEREVNYPTGLDLAPISQELPNIAIPHTESEFVNTTRIVPIKLKKDIPFHNMIQPDEVMNVRFLFMILNQNGEEQSGLLADIMDFINSVEQTELIQFFNEEDPKMIYQFLKKNFKGENLND
ncbi:PTS sugar transporter subunit IIA [Enterococcus sp. ALS3]|uniref:PTS sugar transporter subunit IIA n=1 Tax=Enterococcus alishanensis TaxID=1303817 RepID=A0ABS6TA38_9ENTE|nr:PTS sugar transporter subunit IIA [Enterococcus alishanensis]MBV7389769.1 PTS sugar transporter subunit IIA [Enterococcus alishanensis]